MNVRLAMSFIVLTAAMVAFTVITAFSRTDPAEFSHPQPATFDAAGPDLIRIDDVPFELGQPGFCGEACLAMYLNALGSKVDQADLFDLSGIDPVLGRGCNALELAATAKNIGFDVGKIALPLTTSNKQEQLGTFWQSIQLDLEQRCPSIVRVRDDGAADEKFLLVLGVDAGNDQVIVHDPSSSQGKYTRINSSEFLRRCATADRNDAVALVRIRLQGNPSVQVRETSGFTDADYAQHIRKLRTKLPGPQFHIVLQKPFVVVGDESADTVRRRSVQTVKWAVDRLKKVYFAKDPRDINDIWLFKDKRSYQRHCVELFGSRPHTPFGYYSPMTKSLVMNISTGGGTLVHEIVHPFVASNFPDCPTWFNEGLASLYEQSRDNNGRIWGSTNWRLKGLQTAIKDGHLYNFQQLCSLSNREFTTEDRGTNYAQARYLCYYLQEHGKLVDFYRAFRANVDRDPTGYNTLVEILGNPDMQQFQKQWEAYVMKLRFP